MENNSGLDFAYLDRPLLKEIGIEIAALVDVFHRRDAGTLVQQGPKTVVRRYAVGNQELYLKLYRGRRVSRWLGTDWGYRHSFRALRNASRLSSFGIKTAPVLALVREKTNESMESGLFTRSLSPAQVISRYFVERLPPLEMAEERRDILRRLAAFLWNIHAKRIYPKDFKVGNILIGRSGQEYCFYLVDYDGFLFSKTISSRRRLKNLYQVGSSLSHTVSKGELQLFLEAYGEKEPSLSARIIALLGDIKGSPSAATLPFAGD